MANLDSTRVADPRDTLSNSPMSRLQIAAVAITIGLNALDGFDVLSISFASPGIAAEWGVDRAALGIVLAMELVGMAIGSVLLGFVADKVGRRSILLGCLVIMAAGMLMATTAGSVSSLALWRIVTGIGIGGVLALINALVSEFSSAKQRDLCVSLMVIGYPIGAVVGGLIAAHLLAGSDWRSVFYFGAGITTAFIPLTFLFVPESVHWLTRHQPSGALAKINRSLVRMGHPPVASLPQVAVLPGSGAQRLSDAGPVANIFSPRMVWITLIVTAAYFFHVITFYYTLKWIPKIVVDMGFKASAAAGILVWANVGGAVGGAVFGLLSRRFDIKALTLGVMLMSTVMVIVFGHAPADLKILSIICGCTGFFTNGAVVGLYALFAHAFPTPVRASGTGFAIGVGRGGSMIGPVLAGYLFKAGLPLSTVSMVIAAGSTIGAFMLTFLKRRPDNLSSFDSQGAFRV